MWIEIDDIRIEQLLESKNTKKRIFINWTITQLLNEAIFEFKNKYKR